MNFETLEVAGFVPAIHGMRNPKNSWDRKDSFVDVVTDMFRLGENDKKLAQTLIKGGPVHSKFLRQIQVWVDITAPIYWWSEFDTYKVGVTRNSCSTMHKLIATIKSLKDDPEFVEWVDKDGVNYPPKSVLALYEMHPSDALGVRAVAEATRQMYKAVEISEASNGSASKLKLRLKRMLPSSFLQKATITLSYENIRHMLRWRMNHELPEWNTNFVKWARTLPLSEEFLFYALGGDVCGC